VTLLTLEAKLPDQSENRNGTSMYMDDEERNAMYRLMAHGEYTLARGRPGERPS
jgi:hypothetical protein